LGDDDPRSLEELVKDHFAGVVTNDDCVRRVFEALEQMGLLDHTAILLSSDHGYFLGEWRFYDQRFMHQPSIRVPLMIRYPRLVKPGTVVEKMALNLDIAPTVLEIAGLKIPERMHGRSLVPFLVMGDSSRNSQYHRSNSERRRSRVEASETRKEARCGPSLPL
jgi:arylsulfatase A-like enzyme